MKYSPEFTQPQYPPATGTCARAIPEAHHYVEKEYKKGDVVITVDHTE